MFIHNKIGDMNWHLRLYTNKDIWPVVVVEAGDKSWQQKYLAIHAFLNYCV
jgi:hypothetical protein